MSSFSSQEKSLLNYGFQKIYEKETPAFQSGLFDMQAEFEYATQPENVASNNRRQQSQVEKYQLFYHSDKHIFATLSSYTANQYVALNESDFYYTLKSDCFLPKKVFLSNPRIEQLYQTCTAPDSSQVYSVRIQNQNWETVADIFAKYEKKQLKFSKTSGIFPHMVISLEYFTTPEIAHQIFKSIEELDAIINSPKDYDSGEKNQTPPAHYIRVALKAKQVSRQANSDWQKFLDLLPPEALQELNATSIYSHNQKNLAALQEKLEFVDSYIQNYDKHSVKKNKYPVRRNQNSEADFHIQHCDEFYRFLKEFKNNRSSLESTVNSKETTPIKFSIKDKKVFNEFYRAFFESIKAKIYKFPDEQLKNRLDKQFNSEIFHKSLTHKDQQTTNFFTFITLLSDSAPLTRYWLKQAQVAEKEKPFLENYLAKKCYKKSFNNLLLSNFQFQFFEHLNEKNCFAHNMVSYFPKQLDKLLQTQSLTDKTVLNEVFIDQGDNFANYIHALLYLDKANIHWWGSTGLPDKKNVLQTLLDFDPQPSIDDMKEYQVARKKLEALFVQIEKQILNENLNTLPLKKITAINKI